MQQKARNKLQHGRDFVRQIFRRMKVPRIETVNQLTFHGVGEVKFVTADDIRLRANAEELALDCIQIVRRVEPFLENGVQ